MNFLGELEKPQKTGNLFDLSYLAFLFINIFNIFSILNGSALINGHVNGEEEHDNDDAESVASSIEDVNEPGASLGNTTTLESEDSEDELISLHESQTLKVRLC